MEKLDSETLWARVAAGESPSTYALKVFSDSDLDPAAEKSVQSTPDLSDLDDDEKTFVLRVMGERARYEDKLHTLGWSRGSKGEWVPPQSVPDVAASSVAAELARFDMASEQVRTIDERHRADLLRELERLASTDARREYARREALARELSRANQMRLID